MPLLCPRPPGWSQVLGWAFPVLSRRLAEALGWHRAPVLSSAGPGRGPRAMSSTRLLFVELYRWVRRVRQLRQEESMDELNRLTTKEEILASSAGLSWLQSLLSVPLTGLPPRKAEERFWVVQSMTVVGALCRGVTCSSSSF